MTTAEKNKLMVMMLLMRDYNILSCGNNNKLCHKLTCRIDITKLWPWIIYMGEQDIKDIATTFY